jgi:hypothetical protein
VALALLVLLRQLHPVRMADLDQPIRFLERLLIMLAVVVAVEQA